MSKDQLFRISKEEHKHPLKFPHLSEYLNVRPGERVLKIPMVLPFYVCAKKADSNEVHRICANEFINWNACLKNLNDAQRELMRKTYLGNISKEETKS
ncbi:hypothetical protein QR680_003180 [Steinernema hermaphroditum]|uniref:Uncharacterized protein n=1 Tax=Steinernema hermaphroditum TaxID=289476 RepID=A0AA39LJP9_9BILA|nr:hypothetical protein QR680_003180 [Steinernema hermaphroditum]